MYSPNLVGHIRKAGITGCVYDESGLYILTSCVGGTLALWDTTQLVVAKPIQTFTSPDLDDIVGIGYKFYILFLCYLFYS